jgi:hypothetical protein
MAFSPDGEILGLGQIDGRTVVMAVPGLVPVAQLGAPHADDPITCLAFGRDRIVRPGPTAATNRWVLATGDQGAGITIWDLGRAPPRTFCDGSAWTVTVLAFHPDGLLLASAGRNEARIWDATTGRIVLMLPDSPAAAARTVAFDATGRYIVCGGERAPKYSSRELGGVWELVPHQGIQVLRGLRSAPRKLWFSPRGVWIAALADDWHLAVWDTASGRLRCVIHTPTSMYADSAGGAFDATGDRFVFATGQEASRYDLRQGKTLDRWTLSTGLSDQIQFEDSNPDLPLLLRREQRAGLPADVWLWHLYELPPQQPPRLRCSQTDLSWSVLDLAFPVGGRQFLAWNGGTNVPHVLRAHDAATGKELRRVATSRTNLELRVCSDPTGTRFGCTMDPSNALQIMRLTDSATMDWTAPGYQAIAEGGMLYAGREHLFLDQTGRRRIPIATDYRPLSFVSSFSPGNQYFAIGTEEGVVLVANIPEVMRRIDRLR